MSLMTMFVACKGAPRMWLLFTHFEPISNAMRQVWIMLSLACHQHPMAYEESGWGVPRCQAEGGTP